MEIVKSYITGGMYEYSRRLNNHTWSFMDTWTTTRKATPHCNGSEGTNSSNLRSCQRWINCRGTSSKSRHIGKGCEITSSSRPSLLLYIYIKLSSVPHSRNKCENCSSSHMTDCSHKQPPTSIHSNQFKEFTTIPNLSKSIT